MNLHQLEHVLFVWLVVRGQFYVMSACNLFFKLSSIGISLIAPFHNHLHVELDEFGRLCFLERLFWCFHLHKWRK